MPPRIAIASAPLHAPLTLLTVEDPLQRRRLATLGLREGASFTLLARTIGGGRILLVGGSRIALGRELVHRLHATAA